MAEYFLIEIADCDICTSVNEKGQPHMLINEQGGLHYCSGKIERQVNLLDVLKKLRFDKLHIPQTQDGGILQAGRFEDLRIEDDE